MNKIVSVNEYNLYQNSIDTKVQQDLKAFTESTQLFMVDTNGEAPCWAPKAKDGIIPATKTGKNWHLFKYNTCTKIENVTTATDCDIYSDGLNLADIAFDNTDTAGSISIQPRQN